MREPKIEIVRGRIGEWRDRLLRLWSAGETLDGPALRRRLAEVVSVVLDRDGEVAGWSAVSPQTVAPVGGRLFWVYRARLSPEAPGGERESFDTAFGALEEEFEPGEAGPIGLCVVADPAQVGHHAILPDSELMLASYLPDGKQVRVRYFEDAAIGPGAPGSPSVSEMRRAEYPLDAGYSIVPGGEVSPGDVLALWEREGALPAAEAGKRIREVLLVAVDRAEGVVGISTAYIKHNPQLRMPMWHFRAFVAAAHRKANLGVHLSIGARDLFERRFATCEDTRSPGMVYEIENPGVKAHFNRAYLLPIGSTFIGENERGDHVYVRYFPGATIQASR